MNGEPGRARFLEPDEDAPRDVACRRCAELWPSWMVGPEGYCGGCETELDDAIALAGAVGVGSGPNELGGEGGHA